MKCLIIKLKEILQYSPDTNLLITSMTFIRRNLYSIKRCFQQVMKPDETLILAMTRRNAQKEVEREMTPRLCPLSKNTGRI